ncbi:MAG: 3-deoxy-7-phosphoheptulonate synthase [Myxococcales bacterium]|nr:3-deoxy-7-phosphoheptulonate synthase [Myxococcales bacterium]
MPSEPSSLEDRNLLGAQRLVPPAAVKARFALTDAARDTVSRARTAVRALVQGDDPGRLLVVVGPCSLHDEDQALFYAQKLKRLADRTDDALVLLMRTYFEKPRTTIGWKGLINDPHLDGSCDIALGLSLARRILLRINELGVPCATEVLDPVTPQYLADLLSWAAIGARTTESQTHRELASGLSMPVGFKNGTDGSLATAANALVSAGSAHSFLGIDTHGATAVVRTRGNPDRHLVLRGGHSGPNHGPGPVGEAAALALERGIPRGVMIDCSHDNSGSDPARQPEVCRSALRQLEAGNGSVLGVMLESHLEAGRQDWVRGERLRYGVSLTDPCLGWEDTEKLLEEAAERVRRTRTGRAA